MRTSGRFDETDGLARFDSVATQVLGTAEERNLLRELGGCKTRLAEALAQLPGHDATVEGDNPQAIAHQIAEFYARQDPVEARLGAIYHRYSELRGKLALANMRLVAHVAKRFRDRGISYTDLIQEGFCGLLEAIDRFDLNHQTKLATYATWWIRQSMQRAVASCAYPVRLSPRHLRQLAQNQDEVGPATLTLPEPGDASGDAPVVSSETIRHIHTATRPTISLDASLDPDSNFNLMQTMSDPEGDRTNDIDRDETVGKMMEALRPREQQVLALRFGLGGESRLSLSQVGKVLEVSKERVRQIQDRALEKLRAVALEHDWDMTMLADL